MQVLYKKKMKLVLQNFYNAKLFAFYPYFFTDGKKQKISFLLLFLPKDKIKQSLYENFIF